MRLPESVTAIAPVGAAVRAAEAGEALLAAEARRREDRLLVTAADEEGLARWERDYGLPDWTGVDLALRRGRIRGAMAGGQTLTPERLRALGTGVGGADRARVREDFPGYTAELTLICRGRLPQDRAVENLERVLERQKPAHLKLELAFLAELALEHTSMVYGGFRRHEDLLLAEPEDPQPKS